MRPPSLFADAGQRHDGASPESIRLFSPGHTLRPQEITVAQSLKAAGYVTGHFGKWHLGSVQKSSPVNPGACGFDKWLSSPNSFDNDPTSAAKVWPSSSRGESSMVAMEAALEFIRDRARKPSRFLPSSGSAHLICRTRQARTTSLCTTARKTSCGTTTVRSAASIMPWGSFERSCVH